MSRFKIRGFEKEIKEDNNKSDSNQQKIADLAKNNAKKIAEQENNLAKQQNELRTLKKQLGNLEKAASPLELKKEDQQKEAAIQQTLQQLAKRNEKTLKGVKRQLEDANQESSYFQALQEDATKVLKAAQEHSTLLETAETNGAGPLMPNAAERYFTLKSDFLKKIKQATDTRIKNVHVEENALTKEAAEGKDLLRLGWVMDAQKGISQAREGLEQMSQEATQRLENRGSMRQQSLDHQLSSVKEDRKYFMKILNYASEKLEKQTEPYINKLKKQIRCYEKETHDYRVFNLERSLEWTQANKKLLHQYTHSIEQNLQAYHKHIPQEELKNMDKLHDDIKDMRNIMQDTISSIRNQVEDKKLLRKKTRHALKELNQTRNSLQEIQDIHKEDKRTQIAKKLSSMAFQSALETKLSYGKQLYGEKNKIQGLIDQVNETIRTAEDDIKHLSSTIRKEQLYLKVLARKVGIMEYPYFLPWQMHHYDPEGKHFQGKKDFTCVPTSLKMVLSDKNKAFATEEGTQKIVSRIGWNPGSLLDGDGAVSMPSIPPLLRKCGHPVLYGAGRIHKQDDLRNLLRPNEQAEIEPLFAALKDIDARWRGEDHCLVMDKISEKDDEATAYIRDPYEQPYSIDLDDFWEVFDMYVAAPWQSLRKILGI